MILVVDINKGFQTQTAECLILAEIIRKPLILVLNKIDSILEDKRKETIEKMTLKIRKTMDKTEFKGCEVVPLSATNHENVDLLISTMMKQVENSLDLTRDTQSPFIFAFDHCFTIRGSGTVLSGTVIQGSIKVNDSIQIPSINEEKKIKSMQKFRKSVTSASCGDRLGICVSNLNAKLHERGLICQKSCLQISYAVIIKVNRVPYFKRNIETGMKLHCSVGHETTIGKILIFSSSEQEEFKWESSYLYEDKIADDEKEKTFFCLIEFQNPVITYKKMLLIASKLDTEDSKVCRIAFHGRVVTSKSSSEKNYAETFLPKIKVHKMKSKEGEVQRFVNEREIIAGNLFKKDTDLSKFINMKCQLTTGETGIVVGSFGKSAKVRIQFHESLKESTVNTLSQPKHDVKVTLRFKKSIFGDKKIIQ